MKIPEIMGLLNLEAMTGNNEFVKGAVLVAGGGGARLGLRSVRDVRGHVPAEDRHRESAADGGGAFRVAGGRAALGRRSGGPGGAGAFQSSRRAGRRGSFSA